MDAWDKKQEWHKQGDGFLIVIRHSVCHVLPKYFIDEVEDRWNVYAYIYPKHNLFKDFNGLDMWQDAATRLPLHGGPSFLKWHYDDNGMATSVQIGSDYCHLYDDRFSNYKNIEEASEVLADAEQLFDYLTKNNVKKDIK